MRISDWSSDVCSSDLEPTGRHVIIVVRIDEQLHGLIVDAVNDIVTVDDEAMQAPPSLSTDSASAFLKGLVAVEDRMVMVLSPDNLAADTRHVVMAEAALRTSRAEERRVGEEGGRTCRARGARGP